MFHYIYIMFTVVNLSRSAQTIAREFGIDYSVYSPMCSNQFLLRVY